MLPFDYILAVSMAISEIWGVIVLWMGACVRFTLGKLVGDFIEGVTSNIKLDTALSPTGQNICPVSETIGDDLDLGEWTGTLGSLMIAVGFLIFLFSIFGMVSASNKRVLLLILTLILIVISAIIEIYLVMIASSLDIGFHDTAQEQLLVKVKNDYVVEGSKTTSLFTVALNGIMLVEECCGIKGMRDFANLTFQEISQEQGEVTVYFRVPPACCKREVFNSKDITNGYELLKACAVQGWESVELINDRGCYDSVFNTLKDGPGSVLVVLYIIAIIWHVIQFILVILVLLSPSRAEEKQRIYDMKKESVASQKAEEARKEAEIQRQIAAEQEALAKKKFIPYSKVSSYNHPDIHRIKSTEIW